MSGTCGSVADLQDPRKAFRLDRPDGRFLARYQRILVASMMAIPSNGTRQSISIARAIDARNGLVAWDARRRPTEFLNGQGIGIKFQSASTLKLMMSREQVID
jgi:hypothetical protein